MSFSNTLEHGSSIDSRVHTLYYLWFQVTSEHLVA